MLKKASTVAGRIRCLRRSLMEKGSPMVYMPPPGSSGRPCVGFLSTPVKTMIMIRPIQKTGTELPMKASVVATWSNKEYWRMAEMMPIGMAISRAMQNAVIERMMVLMSCSPISTMAGRRVILRCAQVAAHDVAQPVQILLRTWAASIPSPASAVPGLRPVMLGLFW